MAIADVQQLYSNEDMIDYSMHKAWDGKTEHPTAIWDAEARRTGTIGPDYDYSKISKLDSRGHGTDLGKLPNHPTFSVESAYSGKIIDSTGQPIIGGTWKGNKFTMSNSMAKNGGVNRIRQLIHNKQSDGEVFYMPDGVTEIE